MVQINKSNTDITNENSTVGGKSCTLCCRKVLLSISLTVDWLVGVNFDSVMNTNLNAVDTVGVRL